MSYTQYASGRTKLPFSNSNVSTSNTGSLGVSGTYYLSIQGENRVGLNLNSNLVAVTVTTTTKITITFPTLLIAEDWQNIIISASLTNDATTLTQIASVNVSDILTPLELTSSEILKLTTSERTVSNASALPSTPTQGLLRFITSLNYYYYYDRYSSEVVNNTTILSASIGRWIRIGSMSTYQEDTAIGGGCDQDIRTPGLNPRVPDYAVDGSKGEPITYWIRNDYSQPIPSGTRVSGIVRIYEEDKSQLFDSLIILEAKGYINLSTGILDVSSATGEINYSPYINELVLEEDLPSGHAIVIEVSPKFKPEHLNNNVPYLANLQMYLTFAPNSGEYAPGSQVFGNFIYNQYDKFQIVPSFGLNAKKLKGSGLISNYEIFAVGEENIVNIVANTDNQYIYLTSNASSICITDNSLLGAVKRAKISTLDGISTPISYGSVSLDNTKQLKLNFDYTTTIRSNYPDIIAGSDKGEFNATSVIVYIKNSSNNYFSYEFNIPLNPTSEELILNYSDFSSVSSLNTNASNFGLFSVDNVLIDDDIQTSTFPTSSYQIYLALKYVNTVTVIDHSVSELYEAELDIANIFSNASSWRKAVVSITELRNINRSEITNYQACYVFSNNYIYFFDPTSTAADDNSDIIRPDTDPGAWIRYSVSASKWLTGTTNPSSSLGNIDDLYLNIFTGDYYQKTDSITWLFLSSLKLNFLNGTTVPSNSLGNVGDYYLDLNTANLYTKTATTTWTLLRKLRIDWLNDSGTPSNSLGNNGDYYIDTDTSEYYFKSAGSWSSIGTISPEFTIDNVIDVAYGDPATVTLTKLTGSNTYEFDFEIPGGQSATINIGTVTTLSSTSSATVNNSGTTSAAIFNFGIPKGSDSTISIGTVTTGSPGSSAIVTNSGTSSAAILDFTIPRGNDGSISSTSTINFIPVSSNPTTASGIVSLFVLDTTYTPKYREPSNGNIYSIATLDKTQEYTARQGIATSTLTDGSTITADLNLSNKFAVTLGGNRTLTANNIADGTYIFRLIQDTIGSRLLSYDNMFKFPGGIVPVLTTDPNAVDILSCESDGTVLNCVLSKDFK
jgi:hypothetical protein